MAKFWDTKFGNVLEEAGKWTLNTFKDLAGPALSSVADMAIGVLGSNWQKNEVNNRMSGAEREAFNLSAQEAQKARDWNLQMDSTKYQRQVADMQSAGINPALAMSGRVSTQATSNATANASTQQAPMMSVMDLATTAANLKNLQAQRENTLAQARLANANAAGTEIANRYRDRLELAIAVGQENAANLTKTEIDQINQNIEESKARVKKFIAEAKTEEDKQNALKAQALLDQANAEQIKALTPVLVELKKAETNEAKARAAEAFARAAYQQGLIDEGYVKELAREQGAKADEADAIALRVSSDNAKRGITDTMSNGQPYYTDKFSKAFFTSLWQLGDILSNGLSIGVSFQGNTHKSQSTSTNTNTNTSTNRSENVNWNLR